MQRLSLAVALAAVAAHADVAGIVVDAATGLPLPNAAINVRKPGALFSTRSGPDGRFVIPNLDPGRFPLGATLAGYYSVQAGPSLGAFADANPLVVRLQRAASLRGTIRTAHGRPVPQAEVLYFAGDAGDVVRSDREGRFRFPALPPGPARLYVRLSPERFFRLNLSALVSYPNPLALRAGEDRWGIDVVVPHVPRVAVSGRVIDPATHAPVARGQVSLQADGRDAWAETQIRAPLENGRFRFAGVRPGDYYLVVHDYPDAAGPLLQQRFTVGPTGVAGRDFLLPRTGTIEARVTRGSLRGEEIHLALSMGASTALSANRTANGGYRWRDLSPGTWRPSSTVLEAQAGAQPLRSFRIASITQGGRKLEQGVEIVPGPNPPLEILVVPQAVLTGRVVDAAGTPMPRYGVLVTRDDGAPSFAFTEADGTFALGLAPGSYRASARGKDAATFDRTPCRLGSVPVRMGESGTVSLRLKPCE